MRDLVAINFLPEWMDELELPPRTMRIRLLRQGLRKFHGTWLTGAAVAVVDRDRSRVLLVRQSYREGFALPGGILHRREPPAQAAAREVFEETGLELDLTNERPVLLIEPKLMQVHLLFRFEHPVADTRARGRYRREVSESDWYPLDALPSSLQYVTVLQLAKLGLLPASCPTYELTP
jgi:8-oxo-dGTP pyrophosphatase MutT (NUDIX family)